MTNLGRRGLAARGFAAAVVLGLIAAGSSSAATDPDGKPAEPLQGVNPVHKTLANTCAFDDPVGKKPLAINTSVKLPMVVQAGKPVTVTDFTLSFTLPRDLLVTLTQPDAVTSIEGTATVELTAVREDKKTPLPVTVTIPSTQVPATGDLVLTGTGQTTGVVMTVAGKLTLTTGAPTFTLTGKQADAAHPLKPVVCTVDADQDATLGSVVMLAASEKPKDGKPGEVGKSDVPGMTTLDDPPPDPLVIVLQPFDVRGTSLVAKSGAFMRLAQAVMVNAVWKVNVDGSDRPNHLNGQILFPPTRVTYLGYGFIPISATFEQLPVDYATGNQIIDIDAALYSQEDGTITARSTTELYGRLSEVTVNGTPLDVGPDCKTATPIKLSLVGPKYDLTYGGPLSTDPKDPDPAYHSFTLPPFSGCGVSESLDRLLSGQNSGDDNQVCIGTIGILSESTPPPPFEIPKCPHVDLPGQEPTPPPASAQARHGGR